MLAAGEPAHEPAHLVIADSAQLQEFLAFTDIKRALPRQRGGLGAGDLAGSWHMESLPDACDDEIGLHETADVFRAFDVDQGDEGRKDFTPWEGLKVRSGRSCRHDEIVCTDLA